MIYKIDPMRRPQTRMKESGFTLMEVIIVTAFIGLLAGVAFPRIADVQSRFAVRGAVTAFMSAHSLTRATAIRAGGVAELHIDATNDRFWIEVDTTLAGFRGDGYDRQCRRCRGAGADTVEHAELALLRGQRHAQLG